MDRYLIWKRYWRVVCFVFFTIINTWPGFCAGAESVICVPGEEIDYVIKWHGVPIGTGRLNYHGETTVDNQKAILITMRVDTLLYKGIDKVYGTPNTFCPLLVERDIRIAGRQESILERYDQKMDRLTITKTVNNGEKKQIVKEYGQDDLNDSKLQNVLLLIYWLRQKDLKVGDSFSVALPSGQCEINVVKEENVSFPMGDFHAFFLKTKPDKFRFWIETGNQRLPLKIEKTMVIGVSSIIITGVADRGGL